MFLEWFDKTKGEKSWERVCKALSSQSVRESVLADNLRSKVKAAKKATTNNKVLKPPEFKGG